MITLTATEMRKKIFQIPNEIKKNNQWIRISYKTWNMVMIEEEEYENLLEHLHIIKDKKVMDKIEKLDDLEFEQFNSLKELNNAI